MPLTTPIPRTLRGMRRATRKSDPYNRPSTPPALTPFVREQVEAAIQHLKETAIDYGLAKDRTIKTKGYITGETIADLHDHARKVLSAAREYSRLFRIVQAPKVIHTRE